MKIRETFENRKKNGQKALVTYIVLVFVADFSPEHF